MTGLIGLKTWYSLLWGTDDPEVMFRRAAELGWCTVAVTDHESLCALPAIARRLDELPCRVVFGATLRFASVGDRVVALVEDATGYANLCRIITRWHADRQGIDLAGSPIGQVPLRRALCPGGPAEVIGDRVEGLLFIVESPESARHLLHHDAAVWHRVGHTLARPAAWVGELGLSGVFVPELCMADPSRHAVHRLLRAIARGTSVEAVPESACAPASAHLHSPGHYRRRFGVFQREIAEVDVLLERARFTPDASTLFPPSPHRGRAIDVLRRKAYDGAVRRYGEPSDSVIARMEYELELIESKGFAEYFLVVEDIVATSPRTCGRGSGAASLVNYCLGVTNVDPIRYNLMFERFLNPGRTDPPDIDIDFAWDERDDVLDEAFARYGRTRAAMVCNHLRFQPRMALRETARTMGLTEDEISRALERMPEMRRELGPMTVAERGRVDTHPENRSVVVKLPAPWDRVVPMAAGLVGLPRMLSMHCGGMVIVPEELARHVPVETSAKGYPMIQWEKDGTEEMGLVKIDLLGNRSLAVIRDAARGIAHDEGRPVDTVLPEVPADDPDTRRLVARGDTMGVFYVESPSMRLLQKKADRGDFEHLVIHSSIIRPAANHYINEYLDRLHGKPWVALHPRLAGVFDETYGVPVYQEDVSKLAMALAGYNATEADRLRKCLGKRDAARRLAGHKDEFYRRAGRLGVPHQVLDEAWQGVMSMTGYSFCKPHSASYAQVSYESAWLKAHYPAHFMAAVISNGGGYYSTQAYVSEAMRMGLRVLGPDVNRSDWTWCSDRGSLRVGLMSIKGLRGQTARAILDARRADGPYRTLSDFCRRTGLAGEDLHRLCTIGALDTLAPALNRPQLLWIIRQDRRHHRAQGELFAPSPRVPVLPPFTIMQRQHAEYASLGFLLQAHPLSLFEEVLRKLPRPVMPSINMPAMVGRRVSMLGWPVTGKVVSTKHREPMEFFSFEDGHGIYETILFPRAYARYARLLEKRQPLVVTGRVESHYGACTLNVESITSAVRAAGTPSEPLRRQNRLTGRRPIKQLGR